MTPDSLSAEELFVQCAQSRDTALWQEFARRFHRTIALTVQRLLSRYSMASSAVRDDLIQDVYLKLCEDDGALLLGFNPHHERAAEAFLKVVTANLVRDHFRNVLSKKRGGGLETSIEVLTHEPTVDPMSTIYGNALLSCIERALRTASPDEGEQKIFWLYYREGLTAKEISELPGCRLSTKGIESLLFRLTRAVRRKLSEGELVSKGN